MGSPRTFGLVFAVVFAIIGLFPLLVRQQEPYSWAMIASGLFGLAAWLKPGMLKHLNYIWYRFGLMLHMIANPVIMALLFVITVVPTGLVLRVLRKDIIRLKVDASAESYWVKRDRAELDSGSMAKQF